ncbi:MAG: ATP-grasp domain-containing protein [Bacteroidales bacterium]|nr:ATP-grasp domain-containing protein [Bacteroidales bacterium]
MKRALILGTNAGQTDIINYLTEDGWEVHACGYKKEGPGCDLASSFHLVDTTDIEAVTNLAKDIFADLVYSVSSDSAIRTVTKVAERLDLPRFLNSDIIDLFHFKDKLRAFLNENNINTVAFNKITSIEESSSWDVFPCVVKPSDSQGQRGIELIFEKEKLFNAVKIALSQSSSGTAIIEEYLEGIEISTNVIVQDGIVLVNEFTERVVHGIEYFGLPKGHNIPVRNVSELIIKEAGLIVEKLVARLSIKDAVLYIQMKVTKNGPKIIEVAPRLDGCHIWRLIKKAKGYDLRQYAIDCLTGKKIDHNQAQYKNTIKHSLYFYQLKTGSTFKMQELVSPFKLVYNEYRYEENEIVQSLNGNLEVVGYYIIRD